MKQQIIAHFDWMIGSLFVGELPNFEAKLAMDFMVNTQNTCFCSVDMCGSVTAQFSD